MKHHGIIWLLVFILLNGCSSSDLKYLEQGYSSDLEELGEAFKTPPDSTRPWVIWHWINGNISKSGITADLEALKVEGIGGVIQMEISGPQWAPQGEVKANSPEWHDAMQWAISESGRLGLDYNLTIDYGYGSGGPHITPDLSMQKLVWSQTICDGGCPGDVRLRKPELSPEEAIKTAWLRPGTEISPQVLRDIREIDSYRDIAVFAYPIPSTEEGRSFRNPLMKEYDGRVSENPGPFSETLNIPESAVIPENEIVDLSGHLQEDGLVNWDAPPGQWLITRLGYGSNFRFTRPCPQPALGLECDRLHPRGIEAHFASHLKPILEAAGKHTGTTMKYLFLDSWEAFGQNWTIGFAREFMERRGYDIGPWLPVLTGRIVESSGMTERFLWDVRQTVSEMMLDNYIDRLKQLAEPFNMEFANEPYGNGCFDPLTFGGRVDFPICEFWTAFDQESYPHFRKIWYMSMKAMASVANTFGKTKVGAESFTGSRGWMDHPFLLKGMGDEAFSNGVNHFVIHSSVHQAYNSMVPGLTHRKWGQHFQRHQTWWGFSKPYFDYLARCQFLLQQGRRVADIAYLYQEGSPLDIRKIQMELPMGYDYDLCSPEIIQDMEFRDNFIYLPSGARYRYLILPENGRLTISSAQKIQQLYEAGANVVLPSPIEGTPGLEGYPEADEIVRGLASNWDHSHVLSSDWYDLFEADALMPDFEGEGLNYTHRRAGGTDIFFVANPLPDSVQKECRFRIGTGRIELWDPESGDRYELKDAREEDGRIFLSLQFGPMQSWFVVFHEGGSYQGMGVDPFPKFADVQEIKGPWNLDFDKDWEVEEPLKFDSLFSWTIHNEPQVKYYSGTSTYTTRFSITETDLPFYLDLGRVEVVARVRINGKDCGIAWKPPYRVPISDALRLGENLLEIDVANTWVNRMIGDEELPLDSKWLDWETLVQWPAWFKEGQERPSGRYTFTSVRHYVKDDPLQPAGLLGPVRIQRIVTRAKQ